MAVTDHDIDAQYGTPRRRLVAKALRSRLPGESAHGLLGLAETALLAVDEDINEQEITGVERAARADAIMALARLYTGTLAPQSPLDVDGLLEVADQLAAYIRDGQVT